MHDFTNHGFHVLSYIPLVAVQEALAQSIQIAQGLEQHCAVETMVSDRAHDLISRLQ
jgi:hypothetical protein